MLKQMTLQGAGGNYATVGQRWRKKGEGVLEGREKKKESKQRGGENRAFKCRDYGKGRKLKLDIMCVQ